MSKPSLSKTAGTEQPPPHALPVDELLDSLETDGIRGLSGPEAAERLERDGPNRIRSAKRQPWWKLLARQFESIVILLLAVAALVSWLTASPLEAAAIVVVLMINAVIGFAIEFQAGVALEALRRTSRTRAVVIRDGSEASVDAEDLVRGDLISLAAGDKVPADARLIAAFDLRADESTLTGESLPVDKSLRAVEADTSVADRSPMVFLGSTITNGSAKAVVTGTGDGTELGRVGSLLSDSASESTPLERRLAKLGERLVYIVLGIAAVVFVAGLLRGDGLWVMIEVAISLAVAAVPEGLPAVTTLILALGVLRMARKKAIVRKLAAVETLGSTTVICTDKTGTLTENRISVSEFHCADGSLLAVEGKKHLSATELRLVSAGVLCNDASLQNPGDQGSVIGDPTETALLAAAISLGVSPSEIRRNAPLVQEIPFDPALKRMIAVRDTETGRTAVLKGAPAVVIGASESYLADDGEVRSLTEEVRESFLEKNRGLAGKGSRVLAFADKPVAGDGDADPAAGFTFLGFAAMSDPLRAEAADSIAAARRAGIRIVMLTGDQVNTADSIARELGLVSSPNATKHASELPSGDGEDLDAVLEEARVFARVTPEDKYRIVEALRKRGEIVAVTGDGVNDAPAMKQADIGVAMGMRGTEVAKEAADMILTDDNFATIVTAIEGGRTIYSNIVRFVHMMFAQNLGEIFLIFTAILIGLPLPLMPLQILWVNLVTDVFPALALAVEPPSRNIMNRPPRPSDSKLLSAEFLTLIGWQGVTLGAIALGSYLWALGEYGPGDRARSIAVLSVIGVQLGHFFTCRSRVRSVLDRPFSNPWIFVAAGTMVVLQIVALYLPPLAGVLGLVAPTLNEVPVLATSVVLPILIVETAKFFTRRRLADRTQTN